MLIRTILIPNHDYFDGERNALMFWLFARNRDCPRQFGGKSNSAEFDMSKLIEMECKQMKSNENEITTHLNGSFAVPFTMTIKKIVISDQDCFDGERNALIDSSFVISIV